MYRDENSSGNGMAPHIYRLPNKKAIGKSTILRYQDTIKSWYKKTWVQNQIYDYKIDNVSFEFLQSGLIVARFNLKSRQGVDFSLFTNPPTDSNDEPLVVGNMGNLVVDSDGIKNLLISP